MLWLIIAGNFPDSVTAASIGAKNDVPDFYPFTDGPKHPTGQPGGYLAFFRLNAAVYRDEGGIEGTPAFRQCVAQVLVDTKIRANKIFSKATRGVHAASTKHETIISHESFLPQDFCIRYKNWQERMYICAG